YFALTLAAQNARIVKDDHAQFEKVCTRIRTLLQEDVDNGFAEAVVKLDEFNQDPEKWLNQNFNPPPGWSFEAETDWSQWQTH
ncbi:MAG: hypothetical protein IH594_15495, partial [Bacteroidales bacterium]|nr:hypothetical protein [Bacteroidales bacterium]